MRYAVLEYSIKNPDPGGSYARYVLIQSIGFPQGTEDKVRKLAMVNRDIDEMNGIKIVADGPNVNYLLVPEDNPVFNIGIILRALHVMKLNYSVNFSIRKSGSKIITKMLDGSSILP